MQLSAHPHRHKASAALRDHTPRPFEITTTLNPSQSPESDSNSGTASMGFAAGPLYTNAIMGQIPSAQQREDLRKASSTILREDSIKVELHDDVNTTDGTDRQDSFSIHHACTDQAPYTNDQDGEMMTQNSLLLLPRKAASHDLAQFLRTTGPMAPHRKPSKVDRSKRAAAKPKNVLNLFKSGHRRPTESVTNAHRELNDMLQGPDDMLMWDEGGLLIPEHIPVEQKISTTGKKYFALKVPDEDEKASDNAPTLSPDFDILDSSVSISFADENRSSSALDTWLQFANGNHLPIKTPAPSRPASGTAGADRDHTVRLIEYSSSPVRPAASNPPTPQPNSATSIAESYQLDLSDHPARRSFDATRALSSHPIDVVTQSGTPVPKLALPREEFPVKLPSTSREVEIRHPTPRRFASHPVLLHRAPSIASSMYPRSFSDSPGPPPPKSPLRLCREPVSTGGTISPPSSARRATPKMAPIIKDIDEHASDQDLPAIVPSIITECTGPITKTRDTGLLRHPLYPASRKEREERIRQQKLRDQPYPNPTIDAVVNAPPLPVRRLRKARPQIQIPDLKPAPLATRASSSASSNASCKKVTENTTQPVSPVPSADEKAEDTGEKTGYTPVSPATTNGSPNSAKMALSPVMLVAEEVPLAKAKSQPKPTRLILRGEGTKYNPRPRSASISRTAIKRRSRSSLVTVSRPATPEAGRSKDETPPLPSPPPNRALPPTPPASGSERVRKAAKTSVKTPSPTDNKKELPIPPAYKISPPAPLVTRHNHVATQDQRTSGSSKSSSSRHPSINARLEALERQHEAALKQNALLSAALMAVLKTNGSLNSPITPTASTAAEPESPKEAAWINRIARRSAASHAASSSNGSALEMYMSTRRGSRTGS